MPLGGIFTAGSLEELDAVFRKTDVFRQLKLGADELFYKANQSVKQLRDEVAIHDKRTDDNINNSGVMFRQLDERLREESKDVNRLFESREEMDSFRDTASYELDELKKKIDVKEKRTLQIESILNNISNQLNNLTVKVDQGYRDESKPNPNPKEQKISMGSQYRQGTSTSHGAEPKFDVSRLMVK